jgi:phosphatidylglycerophosphatase A
MNTADPSAVVWDEVLAFWLILWLIAPAGFIGQFVAFGLFRFFDAAKPGPVGWADRLFKARPGPSGACDIGWRQGFGILFDDFVAAGCTLAVIALYRVLLG